MKYKQVTGDEALRLCKAGTGVLAARFVEGMTFQQAAEAVMFLAPEPEQKQDEAPTFVRRRTQAPPEPVKAKNPRKPLDIDVRKVAELKAAGKTTTEMADALGVSAKQMGAWLYNNKIKVEEATQLLRSAKEVAKKVLEEEEEKCQRSQK